LLNILGVHRSILATFWEWTGKFNNILGDDHTIFTKILGWDLTILATSWEWIIQFLEYPWRGSYNSYNILGGPYNFYNILGVDRRASTISWEYIVQLLQYLGSR